MLYTSETRETALAERRFHLYRGQPIPPSRVRYELFQLAVSLKAAMRFPDLEALAAVGLHTASYGRTSYAQRQREYPRSQDIAEACAFLGADGILVPSARAPAANNLIVFCEQGTEIEMKVLRNHGVVNMG